MKLSELRITNLRNITSLRTSLNSNINIIAGSNGSGKTSFLEAIYLLGTGHSFRSRESSSLVTHNTDKMTVYADTTTFQSLSIQKSSQKPTVARLNGEPCLSCSELAFFLPCQLFYQDIFQFIDAGPALRRGVLDWGLFHVKHDYFSLWKDYRRVLTQRNSLLKQNGSSQQLQPWNGKLSELADLLDNHRKNYVTQLINKFNTILPLLTDLECRLQYYKGWDRKAEGKSLNDILLVNYERDRLRQFTHYGCHQADLFLQSDEYKVRHYFSRGQQKIVLFALKFAQAEMLNKPCVFLIDDLTSELDVPHIERIFTYLSTSTHQQFITVRPSDLSLCPLSSSKFTVLELNNGQLTEHLRCFT